MASSEIAASRCGHRRRPKQTSPIIGHSEETGQPNRSALMTAMLKLRFNSARQGVWPGVAYPDHGGPTPSPKPMWLRGEVRSPSDTIQRPTSAWLYTALIAAPAARPAADR